MVQILRNLVGHAIEKTGTRIVSVCFLTLREIVIKFRQWQFTSFFITQDLIFHTPHALSNGVAEEAQEPEPVFMTMPTMTA